MIDVPYHGAADERRCDVPNGSEKRPLKLSTREARPARRRIIHTGPHTANVGNCLSRGSQNAKGDCVGKTQSPVESGAEGGSPDCAEHDLPWQWVMVVLAASAMKLNRDRDAGRAPGSDSKEKSKADTVTDAEHDRVRHHPGEQPQRTVLAAQQIVSEIKTAEHIQANAAKADGRDRVVVHRNDCRQMIPVRTTGAAPPGRSLPGRER